jgi:hypothetical protein
MKKLSYLCAFLAITFLPISQIGATNYTFSGTGEWDETAKWDTYPGITIALGDSVFIQGECTIAFGTSIDNEGVIVIEENYNLICSGSIDSHGFIIVNGELFNDSSVINRNSLEVNGSLTNDATSQLISTQNSILNFNGSVTNNSSIIHYSGSAKFNGDLVNNDYMSILGVIERKSSASGLFLNNDFININSSATFESTVQNSSNGVIIISGSSLTTFSNDADFINEGELRINGGTLHVGSGFFNSESVVKVSLGGILRKKKSILSVL